MKAPCSSRGGAWVLFPLFLASFHLHAATFTVTTTLDSVAGSLRQAILDANNNPGLDTINFNIPGSGVQTLSLNGDMLPDVTDPVIIDGSTQPGYAGTPLIMFEASSRRVTSLLNVKAGGCTIRALNFSKSGTSDPAEGLVLSGPGGNTIAACWFGLDATGTTKARIRPAAIHIIDCPKNMIGGLTPGDRNIVSGARFGIELEGTGASGNVIQGNYIGVDPSGTINLGNFYSGILVSNAPGNKVGGTAPGAGNIVSGNGEQIKMVGTGATGNIVEGNMIGIKADGSAFAGYAPGNGVIIENAGQNRVGGATGEARNVIAGNNTGLMITGADAVGNQVQGNFIGTDSSGKKAIPNQFGVRISGASGNSVGGTAAGVGNVISGNSVDGLTIADGSNNQVQGNFIGTDATGGVAVGNTKAGATGSGLTISANTGVAEGNLVGGSLPAARNVISGNNDSGVVLVGPAVQKNAIQGNFIGVLSDGVTLLGNVNSGIAVLGANGNLIGGEDPLAANHIGGNGVPHQMPGVWLAALFGGFGTPGVQNIVQGNEIFSNGGPGVTLLGRNAILQNRIWNNGGLAIDRMGDGPTPNQPEGPANAPEITHAEVITGGLGNQLAATVQYQGLPNTSYVVDFFATDTADSSGFGECSTFLGSIVVPTDGLGLFSKNVVLPFAGLGPESLVNTTATPFFDMKQAFERYGETSEVSRNYAFGPPIFGLDIAAKIDADVSRPYRPNENFGFDVTIQNYSALPAHQVLVYCGTDLGLELFKVDVPEAVSYGFGTFLIKVPLLGPGESFTFHAHGVVDGGRPVSVFASAYTEDPEVTESNNSAFASADVLPPSLEIDTSNIDQPQLKWTGQTFKLQSSTALDNGVWDGDPSEVKTNAAGESVVTLNTTNRLEFYRLIYDPRSDPQIELYQYSLLMDSTNYPFSQWGAAGFNLPRRSDTNYLNLSLNGAWVLQNIPIVPGAENQTLRQYFWTEIPLSEKPKAGPIWSTNVGFSLTTNTLSTAPLLTLTNYPIKPLPVSVHTGERTNLVYTPPVALTGDVVVATSYRRCNYVFPNREQGRNECAPAAVLNSFEYLNAAFKLGLGPTELDLDKIKAAVHWATNGAPGGYDGSTSWVDYKKAFAEKAPYNIDTTVTTDPKEAMNALNACCDVELRVVGHIMAVQTVTQMANGKYDITVTDDITQGAPGGTVLRHVILDPPAGTIKGTINGNAWSRTFVQFIIECPRPK